MDRVSVMLGRKDIYLFYPANLLLVACVTLMQSPGSLFVIGLCIAYWYGASTFSRNRDSLPRLIIVFAVIVAISTPFYYDYDNNFSTYFGPAGDDRQFFNGVRHLLYGEALLGREINVFSYYLAAALFPIAPFKDITIVDCLIVHWFTATVAIFKLLEFARLLMFRTNLYVTLFFCLSSFVFLDSVVHLYREFVIVLFSAMALNKIHENKKVSAFLFSIPVFLFRAASLLPLALFWVLGRLKIVSPVRVLVVSMMMIMSLGTFLPPIVKFGAMYGSDVTRVARREAAYSVVEIDQIVESRKAISKEHTNEIKRWAYDGLTPVHIVTRIAFTYAFPISVRPLEGLRSHSRYGQAHGFFTTHAIINSSIFLRGFLLASLLVGVLKARSRDQLTLTATLIIFSILVVMVSGQSRHLLIVHAISALYATHGLLGLRKNSIELGIFALFSSLYILTIIIITLQTAL